MDAILHESFRPAMFRVFKWRYSLPVFWIAIPVRQADDAIGEAIQFERQADVLTRLYLDVPDAHDRLIDRCVINGRWLILRRFRAQPRQQYHDEFIDNTPHYLILPTASGPMFRDGPADGGHDLEQVVRTLTDLEALCGSRLYHVQADLEIWQNHLEVYDAVAARAMLLWDGLSTHLPMQRWGKLGRTHRTVELLHQFLLQGVADLAHLTTLTSGCLAAVNDVADTLQDDYDAQLGERRSPHGAGLRAAIAETGAIARVRGHAQQIVGQAARAKTNYGELLTAIGSAFDERRARESDVAQRAGTIMTFVLALIGVVTVLDATIQMKPVNGPGWLLPDVDWLPPAAILTSLVAGAIVVAAAVWIGARLRWGTSLGSRQFRDLYDGRRNATPGLWQFLKDASTEELDAFSNRAQAPTLSDWRRLDDELAHRFAALWDAASRMEGLHRDDARAADVRALARRVEQWGVHALLITERARRMHRYLLPKLTCLYRVCTLLPGSFVSTVETRPDLSAVAEKDFVRSIQRLGQFTRKDVLMLDEYLLVRQPATARAALTVLHELQLTAEMAAGDDDADDARLQLVDRIRAGLDAHDQHPEPPRPGPAAPAHQRERGRSLTRCRWLVRIAWVLRAVGEPTASYSSGSSQRRGIAQTRRRTQGQCLRRVEPDGVQ